MQREKHLICIKAIIQIIPYQSFIYLVFFNQIDYDYKSKLAIN